MMTAVTLYFIKHAVKVNYFKRTYRLIYKDLKREGIRVEKPKELTLSYKTSHYSVAFRINQQKTIEDIMDTYGNEIKRLIYTYLNNKADTDDVNQEVFVAVYLKLDSFQGYSSLRSWIYSIAINKCKDYLRSWRVRNHKLIEKITKLSHLPIKFSEVSEEHTVKLKETDLLLEKVLDLSIKYREVIILYYFKDLSIKEISYILKEKEPTVQTRLSRARKKLKVLLLSERGMDSWINN